MAGQQRSPPPPGGRHHPRPRGRTMSEREWMRVAPELEWMLTPEQIAAIRSRVRLVVEADLANGVSHHDRMYCDACQRLQRALGFIEYDRHLLCNGCATEHEVARARGLVLSAGQFVRDKTFGEAEAYALPALE